MRATGAAWAISGTAAAGIAVTNNGNIIAPSTLTIEGALTGAVTIALAGSLALDGDVARGQKIRFTGAGETIALAAPSFFAATIQKFAPADTIDLTGIALSSITASSFYAGVLTLSEITGSLTFTFANPAAETFALFADGTGTGITLTGADAADSLTPASYAAAQTVDIKQEIFSKAPIGWLTHELITATPSHSPAITFS